MDRGGEAVLDPDVGLGGAADREPAEEVVALVGRQAAAGDATRKASVRRPRGRPGPTGWKPVASGAGAPVLRSSRRALRETQSRNR